MAKVLVITLETLLDVKGRMLPVIFSSVKPVSQVWMFVRAALSQVCTSNEVGFGPRFGSTCSSGEWSSRETHCRRTMQPFRAC